MPWKRVHLTLGFVKATQLSFQLDSAYEIELPQTMCTEPDPFLLLSKYIAEGGMCWVENNEISDLPAAWPRTPPSLFPHCIPDTTVPVSGHTHCCHILEKYKKFCDKMRQYSANWFEKYPARFSFTSLFCECCFWQIWKSFLSRTQKVLKRSVFLNVIISV